MLTTDTAAALIRPAAGTDEDTPMEKIVLAKITRQTFVAGKFVPEGVVVPVSQSDFRSLSGARKAEAFKGTDAEAAKETQAAIARHRKAAVASAAEAEKHLAGLEEFRELKKALADEKRAHARTADALKQAQADIDALQKALGAAVPTEEK